MEVFGDDFWFGKFHSQDYDLDLCSFQFDGDSEDDVFGIETKEVFVNDNPYSIYQGQNYSFKLEGTITLMRSPCRHSGQKDLILSEHEFRAIMREITGARGYQWMKIVSSEVGENIWYKARVKGVKCQRIGGEVFGIVITVETNSYMGYSEEFRRIYNLQKDIELLFYSDSDDLNNYLYPNVTLIPSSAGKLEITNLSDVSDTFKNGYSLIFDNVAPSVEITMNGEYQIIKGRNLDGFNGHWIRLLPGENRLISNMDVSLQLIYRMPRKVGFICK